MPPLAERMRPQAIEQFVGQTKIVGTNRIVNKILQAKNLVICFCGGRLVVVRQP